MKLLEIAPDFMRSQMGTLLTILQHLESRYGKGVKVPFENISSLMQNIGYNVNYDDFKKLYDQEPRLKALVSNFNQNDITLGKDTSDDNTTNSDDASKIVDKLAKSKAKDLVNN